MRCALEVHCIALFRFHASEVLKLGNVIKLKETEKRMQIPPHNIQLPIYLQFLDINDLVVSLCLMENHMT